MKTVMVTLDQKQWKEKKQHNNHMTQPNVQNWKPPEIYLLKSGPDM